MDGLRCRCDTIGHTFHLLLVCSVTPGGGRRWTEEDQAYDLPGLSCRKRSCMMPTAAYAFRLSTKGTLSLGILARENFHRKLTEDQPRGLSPRVATPNGLEEERRPVWRLQGAPGQLRGGGPDCQVPGQARGQRRCAGRWAAIRGMWG